MEAQQGYVLHVSSETGLDGVMLGKVTSGPGMIEWHLHCWKCEGGQSDSEINSGHLRTFIHTYDKARTEGDLGDSTYHSILIKAQVGIVKILAAWNTSIMMSLHMENKTSSQRPLLIPASLLITTTKRAERLYKELDKLSHCMRLNTDVVAAAIARIGTVNNTIPLAALAASIVITLRDGTAWLRRVLPGHLVETADWIETASSTAPSTSPPASEESTTGMGTIM